MSEHSSLSVHLLHCYGPGRLAFGTQVLRSGRLHPQGATRTGATGSGPVFRFPPPCGRARRAPTSSKVSALGDVHHAAAPFG